MKVVGDERNSLKGSLRVSKKAVNIYIHTYQRRLVPGMYICTKLAEMYTCFLLTLYNWI